LRKTILVVYLHSQYGSKAKFFRRRNAKIAQLVERNLAKVEVAGSNPVFRSTTKLKIFARVVELVDTLDLKSSEHFVRAGSSPALSTKALNNV
jgi:hypothetical protein